ncbi:hypothetical protein D9M68_945030 [compost metagenome]
MVVHQHVRVDRHLVLFGVLAQQFEQHFAVSIGFDDRLSVVAALDHMMGIAGNGEAGQTGHGG